MDAALGHWHDSSLSHWTPQPQQLVTVTVALGITHVRVIPALLHQQQTPVTGHMNGYN
jgi:hypothetical protein